MTSAQMDIVGKLIEAAWRRDQVSVTLLLLRLAQVSKATA